VIADPSASRVEADLRRQDLLSGCDTGRWRVIAYEFPRLDFTIAATCADGSRCEYGFRAELSNYPAQAPMVRIWDHGANAPLAVDRRPKGGIKIERSFQHWGSDTVYRPWDRLTGPHNDNAAAFPHLAWRADRRLSFIFEDLHGILNGNTRTLRLRASA
jgi:hypothetical protein